MSPKKRKSNPRPKSSLGIDLQAAAANKGFDEDSLRMTAADSMMGNSPDMGTVRTPGLYLDPMLDPVLTLFPQDNKREENRRYRHYYKVSPYIRSIIDFHVETPISDFDMRAEESEEIQEYYQDYKDRVNLLEVCTNALRDYWLLGECEPAGTKILMANGTEQDIESIRRGDEVITHTGHVRRVIAPTIRTAHEPLYGVTVRGNGKVPHWMTGNHPVLVAKEGKHPCKQGFWNDACLKPQPCKITAHGRNRLDGTHKIWRYPCKQYIDDIALEFMPVNQLREGDYVVTPQYQEQGTSPTIEMARFLGYYASEGCMIKNDKYTIGYSGVIVANTNDKIAQDMIALGQVLIGRKPSIRLVNNCKVIVFYSVQLAQQIVDLCQGLAPSKVLSDTVMKWPVTHQKEFLKAFVLGDGCVSNGQAILYTSSSKMASQLRTMCVRVGMHPSHCVTNKIGRPPFLKQIKECTIYQIKLSREDSLKIFEDFEKLGQIRSSKNIHFSFIKSGYQFKKISGVKHKEHNGLVYSMEVERDHSYVAEGIAVHNSFTYGNWDATENEFSDFMQYPPEELEIVSAYVSPKKVYALRPNKEVSKILKGMNPSDSTIADYIRTMMPEQAAAIEGNQPYPLKENQLIIMQRTMAQYINRGVSPLLAVVKDLLYEDWLNLYRTAFLQRHSYPLKLYKLGCFSEDTDILTVDGFKNVSEVSKDDIFATFNPQTQTMEYHPATAMHVYDYEGDMIRFKSQHCDIMVTPNHNMWAKHYGGYYKGRNTWHFVEAKDVRTGHAFRSVTKWEGLGKYDDFINVDEYKVPLDMFLKLAGFFVSEGNTYLCKDYGNMFIYQAQTSDKFNAEMDAIIQAGILPIRRYERTNSPTVFTQTKCAMYVYGISRRKVAEYFREQFGDRSVNKRVPTWIKMLPPDKLKIFLDAAILGDGSDVIDVGGLRRLKYHSISKQLCDDIQEIALKLGYSSTLMVRPLTWRNKAQAYLLNIGIPDERKILTAAYPHMYTKAAITKVPYKGRVYCPTVPPHHLVFVRRNGRIIITGQSESKGFIPNRKMFAEFRSQLLQASQDPDYNLVTHPFINVEYVTGQDKILQLIPYYELVKARIFAGLFVSDAIISGEKTPYAAGITFMKGLMNRYLTVRNQLELEIKRKVFYHLARTQKFYMPTKAEVDHKVRARRDEERLIIPEFFWKKANLISNQAVMQMAMSLRDKKEIPMRFIAELMGWDMDDIIYELKREEGTRADPKYRKAVEDAIAKSPDLARKVILGDNVDEALKSMFKEQKEQAPEAPPKTSTPSKGRGESKEFKLPETAGPSTVVRPEPPEGGERPPEASEGKGPAAPPTGGGELPRRPKPGEQEGTPGGAAGA